MYRIRPNSIADKVIRLCNRIDTEPIATVTFMGFMAIAIAVFVAVINATYPIV